MELLTQIEAFMARSHMSPSRFGRLSAGDTRLVADLKAGRRLRGRTEDKIRRYLASDPAIGEDKAEWVSSETGSSAGTDR